MKDIEKYLEDKMIGVRPTGNNSNVGATLLKFDKSGNTLQAYIEETLQTLLVCSQRSDTVGIFKLTMASTKVGNRLMKMMGKVDAPFSQKVRLGDLMIEALFNLKYVKIYRDPSYSKNVERAPYVIQLGDRWGEVADFPIAKTKEDLRGTFFEPPKYPSKDIVKRCKYTKDEWEVVKDSQHILAAHKLEQKEFSVNKEVLDVLKKNKSNFVETKVIPIPKEGNKKKTDDAYYNMRMAMNKAKGKITKDVISKKKKYNKLAEEWNLKLIALKAHSKRTAFEYTIQKATILADEDKFYQTIELDYRGRFYYVESFFNFQGTDASRGVIQFAEGKKITEKGEKWLAIHTAASYNQSYGINEIPDYFNEDYKAYLESEGLDSISVDKMTLEDRAIWTYQNMRMLFDSVDREYMHPEAEKPVTFYACCLEWTKYLPNKEEHLSHLPIQIDGSNNGWQHLGAMSKDEHTGSLVGLIPSVIQKDFYVQTAKQLVHQMPKWFEERDMPMKSIRKGISKRGSMTRAYSAGEKVIGTNMYADCYQEGYTEKYNISIEDCNELSHNLIGAINTVCPGPLDTMSFLQKLSAYEIGSYKVFKDGKIATNKYKDLKKEIKDLRFKKDKSDEELQRLSEATNDIETYEQKLVEGNGSRDIRWTTPSGFYVIYENYLTRSIQCKGSIKGLNRISHVAKEVTDTPNLRGIMSGISPNFVHSMDSSHMAIVIDNWEGAFAAVHDAYASHADDIDLLVAITKESFIAMYNTENFYDYIEETLLSSREGLTVEQPKLGNLNIEDIRNSDYFFA